MSAQVAADLRAAADVLERDGWTQEKFETEDGCHCAAGAIAVASSVDIKNATFSGRWRMAMDALCRSMVKPEWPVVIYRWNDAPDRTAAEVIAALRTAADRAEAEQ